MKIVISQICKLSSCFALFACLLSWNLHAAENKAYVCEGEYALCTTAECFPVPGQPEKAICTCKAEIGYSAGYKPCDTKTEHGYKVLKSRYSPIESYVQCFNSRAWASCLDSPCIVDPNDPKKAYCTCDVVKGKGDYVLPSDTCNKAKCEAGLWSSATTKDWSELESELRKAEHDGKFPAGQAKLCK